MRVLLDECVPRRLSNLITGHQVTTVPKAGLAGLKNGELIRQAAGRFDILVTDRSLPDQQNLRSAGLAVIILVAISNRFDDLAPLITELLSVLPSIAAGQALYVPSKFTP